MSRIKGDEVSKGGTKGSLYKILFKGIYGSCEIGLNIFSIHRKFMVTVVGDEIF